MDFANVIKLPIQGWGGDSGLTRQAPCNHRGPYKRNTGGEREEKGTVTAEAEIGVMWPQEKEFRQSLESGKGNGWIPSWSLQKDQLY